jgi:hypothetical protein
VIRYYDFLDPASSGIVPSADVWDVDELSDVNGNNIAFARQHADLSRSCMVFDRNTLATIEIAPGQGAVVWLLALGSDTVAFVNSAINDGDIVVGKISDPGAPLVNLSNSWRIDTSPAVSPLGDGVVWASCERGTTDCDVMKSVRSGGIWGAAQFVSDTTGREHNPDTDGFDVTYDSNRAGPLGGGGIFFQLLSGGWEFQLELDGLQRNPSISGGVIAFEHKAPGATAWDVYVYSIATNTVFQVTNTPVNSEILSDVSVLPDGRVRVVWATDDDFFSAEHNIYARTFSLPAGDTTAPAVTITTPADGALYTKGQVVGADYACEDEPGGSGVASCDGPVASGDPIDTASVGGHLFAVTGSDNAGNEATLEHGYGVVFSASTTSFFSQPVDNLPVLNSARAGQSVPVKFSLGGDQGLAILAPGYPKSQLVPCDSSAPVDGIEETVTAGGSSLSYDAASGLYKYIWKTDRSWAGTCRQLVLGLADGTFRHANFMFR